MARTRRQFLAAGAAGAAAAYAGTRALRGTASQDGPNVLVVMVDTLRADHAFGPLAPTPNLDALRAQGLSFTRAFPEAMPTVPARNSFLAGRRMFPFRGWVDQPGLLAKPGWSGLEDVELSFTSALRRAGWWTGYVTDNPFLGYSRPYEPLRRSFHHFQRIGGQIGGADRRVPAATLERWVHPAVEAAGMRERVRRYIANADYGEDESQSFAARVFGSGIEALELAARNRPFALVIDTFEPHEPWTPPRRYVERVDDSGYDGPEPAMPFYGRVESWLEAGQADLVLRRLEVLYAAEVAMTDHWLGLLFDRLHALDLERETVVVLASDHGIQLGEHGWTGKISVALHPALIQVPLLLVDPERRRAGDSSDYYASLHDLGRTLLAGCEVRVPGRMDGADLSALLRGDSPDERAFAYGGWSNQHYVRTPRWSYMSDNRFEKPKLFDLSADPDEVRDLAEEQPDVVGELAELVREQAHAPLPAYG